MIIADFASWTLDSTVVIELSSQIIYFNRYGTRTNRLARASTLLASTKWGADESWWEPPPPVAVFLTNLTLLQIMLHLQCLLTGYFMCLGRGNAHIFMGIWTPFWVLRTRLRRLRCVLRVGVGLIKKRWCFCFIIWGEGDLGSQNGDKTQRTRY